MLKNLLILLLLITATIHAMDQRLYKYPDAKNDYVKATKEKDQDSAFQLALFYEMELKDSKNAIVWYKIAYEYGSSSAAYNLGSLYEDNKHYEESLNWYTKAAKRGDIKAPRALGLVYKNIYKDYQSSIKWYKKAYAIGDLIGASNLGYLYDTTLKNEEQAIFWYKKAAKGGYAKSINNLNKIYHEKGDKTRASAYTLAMVNYGYTKKQVLDFLKNERKIDRVTLEKAYKLQQTLDIPKHYTGGID